MADRIERQLEMARQRERAARARTSRLRRELDRNNRRSRNQIKFTLGAAMLALAESGKGDAFVANFTRWLDHYLARPTDRAVLRGSPFSLDAAEANSAE